MDVEENKILLTIISLFLVWNHSLVQSIFETYDPFLKMVVKLNDLYGMHGQHY